MRDGGETSKRVASDPRAGWVELQEARWDAARASFQQALATEATPEALEGLSWAAWWLDDAAAVFEARERAYGLYRKRGDGTGAARMATWLAADHLDFHGAWAVASGWLRRAHRLLDPLEPGPDHGWLAFHEGFIAHANGDMAQARELAGFAAELGRRFEVVDLEMLGLALDGAALVACAEVDEGMQCLDEATAVALEGEAAIPISSAWACCMLVSACTAVLDYERAFEWCDRIAEFADRYGSRYMLAFCRAEYGAVHLWRGRWSDAEPMLRASVEDYSRSRPRGRRALASYSPSSGGGRAGPRRLRSCSTGWTPIRRRRSVAPAWRSTGAKRSGPSSFSSACFGSCRGNGSWIASPSSRLSSPP